MERKRYQFVVNTSNTCVFCLREAQEVGAENTGNGHIRNFSLNNIVRFLNINMKEIKSLSKKSTLLLNRTDVRVSLCSECGEEMERFSEHYKAMELSRMKLESTIQIIQGKLTNSNEKTNLLEKYQRKIEESSEVQPKNHLKIFRELREEIVKKSSNKISGFRPKVVLKRAAVNLLRRKIKSVDVTSNLISNENVIPNMPTVTLFKSEITSADNDDDDVSNPPEDFDDSFPVEDNQTEFISFSSVPDSMSCPEVVKSRAQLPSEMDTKDNVTVSPAPANEEKEIVSDSMDLPLRTNDVKNEQAISVSDMYIKNSKTGTFDCTVCNKRSRYATESRKHYEMVHLHIRKFKCDICGGGYSSAQMLRIHKKKCNGTRKPSRAQRGTRSVYNAETAKYNCVECKKEFEKIGQVREHYLHTHLKQRRQCDICKIAVFKSRSGLYEHKRTCKDTLQSRLKKKIARETDPQFKFVCPTCNKRYPRPSLLKKHHRAAHMNIRDFNCDLCDRSFTLLCSLKRHKQADHFGKTWNCKACQKRFSFERSRQRHERRCAKEIKIETE